MVIAHQGELQPFTEELHTLLGNKKEYCSAKSVLRN